MWPGPGSFLAPSESLCPRRSLSTNPQRWFLAHLPSTSPEQSRREQQSRAGGTSASPSAPNLPSPRKPLQELQPCSAAWEKAPGLQSREGARARGSGRSVAQGAPSGTEPREKAGNSPSGWDPSGFSVLQEPGHGPVAASLPNLGSCCQATVSLGVPWLSAGSGRHL